MGSGAIGPIPNSKVTEYGERHGLHPDMLAVFETVLFRLDTAYMNRELNAQKLRQASADREAKRGGANKTKIR